MILRILSQGITCNYAYILINHSSCISCPETCNKCYYNETLKELKCLNCKSGYFLNPKNECISCGDHCSTCQFDERQNPICKGCFSGYMLTENNKCTSCPGICYSCKKMAKIYLNVLIIMIFMD